MPLEMGPDSPRWEKTLYGNGSPGKSTELKMAVEWKGGCRTDVEKQDPRKPLGDDGKPTCYYLFFDNWDKCKLLFIREELSTNSLLGINGGVGGWKSAGCLTYYFHP